MFAINNVIKLINDYEIDKVIIVISAIFVLLNYYVSIAYCMLCEQTYGIPRLYFKTDFKYKILEIAFQIVLVFIFLILYKLRIRASVPLYMDYILRFLIAEGISLALYQLFTKTYLGKINNNFYIIIISILALLFTAKHVKEFSIVSKFILSLLFLWISYKIDENDYKQKYDDFWHYINKYLIIFVIIYIINGVVNSYDKLLCFKLLLLLVLFFIAIFFILMLCAGNIDIIKLFIDFEHKGNYEVITTNGDNFIVLSHYNDKVLCVNYHFFIEDEKLELYTKQYKFVKIDEGQLSFRDFSCNVSSKFKVIFVKNKMPKLNIY